MADLIQKTVVIGLNQTKRSLQNDRVALLYIADDAEARLTGSVVALAKAQNVAVEYVPTMKKLGKKLGIETGAAAGAILKQ